MKKSNKGFNIIELMIAIAISATLIATIVKSYASLYKLYAYNAKFLAVNHEMRIALQVMEMDINNAGVFGAYSLHNLSTDSFHEVKFSAGKSCTSAWCKLDAKTVGVKSFLNDADIVAGGYSVDGEVIRIQMGGNKLAYAIAKDMSAATPMVSKCQSGPLINKLFLNNILFTDYGIDKSSNFYILSSANSAYLLNNATFNTIGNGFVLSLIGADSCPNPSDAYIEAHSNVYWEKGLPAPAKNLAYDSIDPDIHSMTLSNLITKYYFVASADGDKRRGLYSVTSIGNELSQPELISTAVDKITFSYLLDYASTVNNTGSDLGARYTVCDTPAMNSGRADCKDKWDKVVGVTINMSSDQALGTTDADKQEQKVSETVGWKS
jgi:prepilin-type N-terminal cleavage/methylation domain-containing protein